MDAKYTISAFVVNSPGVLHRIGVLFTRRKLNIDSLTVSETGRKGFSRFTICVKADKALVEKVAKQIRKIIEVVDVYVSENREILFKEIAFIKVEANTPERRLEIEEHALRYDARVVLAGEGFVVVEKTGQEDEIDSVYLMLEPFGVKEFVRSGRIAILKEEQEPLPMPARHA
ncbi:MAG: acetolactate synthase small subunit [bacterium]|nr:acetolactate synthase small subunit [bacterium]